MSDEDSVEEATSEETGLQVDDRVTELEAEVARLKDQLLRALAEQENTRRRAQRDKEDSVKFAAANFAKDLIATPDNLRRALDSVKEEDVKDEVLKTLLAGVAATERALLASFERNGIKRIEPMGEKFDHNFHQAIFEVEHSGKPAGTVVQVLAPGYTMHDRLLRAAMVGVAKGPVGGAKSSDEADGYQRVDRTA